jgi:hypothetical protein
MPKIFAGHLDSPNQLDLLEEFAAARTAFESGFDVPQRLLSMR